MSSRITYQHDDGKTRLGIRESCTYGRSIELTTANELVSYSLPTDDTERLRLAEAILGRPILDINPPREVAAIVYEDELPEVRQERYELRAGLYASCGDAVSPGDLRATSAAYEALARHIEARDSTQRQLAEREVEALLDQLPLSGVVKDDYAMLIARSAYELGARPHALAPYVAKGGDS
ncbi:MAG: hypothetical protein GEU74_12360 [Nitriliruptorales bacterium]|nr:hypothetical protein [Nitriliruptorales bacterium]